MGNYVSVGPWTNGGPPGISAAFLTGVEAVFQQPSGGVESGEFYLSGWSNASGDLLSCWISTLSRTSSILSVTVNTTSGPTNVAAVSTGHIGKAGFQLFTTSTSAQVTNLQAGGTWDAHF